MSQDPQVVCFQCGQATGEPLRVNTLASGDPCPTCQDRVLDALPSLLPSDGPRVEESEHTAVDESWKIGFRPEDFPPEPA